jgi:hypothetical protein
MNWSAFMSFSQARGPSGDDIAESTAIWIKRESLVFSEFESAERERGIGEEKGC